MANEQGTLAVYRDDAGHLYIRIPDEERAAVEQAMQQSDTTGHSYLSSPYQLNLAQAGSLSVLPHAFQNRGIIIVSGRAFG